MGKTKPNGYWTLSKVKIEASKYKTKKEWWDDGRDSYYAAQSYGWIDQCSKHMIRSVKWTKEKIIKEAKNYHYWRDIMKNKALYHAIRKHNFVDKIKSKMKKKKLKWNKTKVINHARQYKTLKEWKKAPEGYAAFNAALKIGCYNECKSHFIRLTKIITKDDVFNEAKKYKRKLDFIKKDPSYYAKACHNGWLNQCCKHMMSNKESHIHGAYRIWTKDSTLKEASKHKKWKNFIKSHGGIYEAVCRLVLKEQIKSKMKVGGEKLTYGVVKKIALKYKTKLAMEKNNASAIRKIYQKGWIELLSHMKTRQEQVKWTKEKTLKAVLECKTRGILRIKYPGITRNVKKFGFDHLLFEYVKRIEVRDVHPKIKSILKRQNILYEYEPRFINSKKQLIIPDFIYKSEKTIYIIEAKSSAGYYKKNHFKLVEKQLLKQKQAIQKKYPKHEICHILVSEQGRVICQNSDYNMSIKELEFFFKNGYYKQLKRKYQNISLNALSIRIQKDYLKKHANYFSQPLQSPRGDQDTPTLGP